MLTSWTDQLIRLKLNNQKPRRTIMYKTSLPWEDRFMMAARPTVFWIAALAVVVGVVVLLRDILLPFVAGIALAYLLDPVVTQIERLGVNRTVAALGIVGLFIIGVGGVMVQVTPLLGTEVADFIEKVPQYIGKLQAFANNPGRPWLRKIIGEGLSEAEQSSGQLTSVAADWIPTFLRSLWSDSRALMSIRGAPLAFLSPRMIAAIVTPPAGTTTGSCFWEPTRRRGNGRRGRHQPGLPPEAPGLPFHPSAATAACV
jgi:AI-2E family transporter